MRPSRRTHRGHVRVLHPRLDDQRSDAVHHHDRVVVLRSHSQDQLVAPVPRSQVLSVSDVAVHGDERLFACSTPPVHRIRPRTHLSRVRIHEHDRDLLSDHDALRQCQVPVIKVPRHARLVDPRPRLYRFVGLSDPSAWVGFMSSTRALTEIRYVKLEVLQPPSASEREGRPERLTPIPSLWGAPPSGHRLGRNTASALPRVAPHRCPPTRSSWACSAGAHHARS